MIKSYDVPINMLDETIERLKQQAQKGYLDFKYKVVPNPFDKSLVILVVKQTENKLLGKVAVITNKDSIYYNEWGTIVCFGGDRYSIAIANGMDTCPVFDRDEFRVPRNHPYQKKQN